MVEDIHLGRFFELATSKKIFVFSLNSHEIKKETLQDCTGSFELNGLMNIGPIEHKTNIRFQSMDDFERYIKEIDVDYESEDVTFTGCVYKLDTPQFKVVRRSAHAKGTNNMQEMLNITDKTVIFLRALTALKNVLFLLIKRLYRKIFNFHLIRKKIDQE